MKITPDSKKTKKTTIALQPLPFFVLVSIAFSLFFFTTLYYKGTFASSHPGVWISLALLTELVILIVYSIIVYGITPKKETITLQPLMFFVLG